MLLAMDGTPLTTDALNRYFIELREKVLKTFGKLESNERHLIASIKDLEVKLERLESDKVLLMDSFVKHPNIAPSFENYCQQIQARQDTDRQKRGTDTKMTLQELQRQIAEVKDKERASAVGNAHQHLHKPKDIERE